MTNAEPRDGSLQSCADLVQTLEMTCHIADELKSSVWILQSCISIKLLPSRNVALKLQKSPCAAVTVAQVSWPEDPAERGGQL